MIGCNGPNNMNEAKKHCNVSLFREFATYATQLDKKGGGHYAPGSVSMILSGAKKALEQAYGKKFMEKFDPDECAQLARPTTRGVQADWYTTIAADTMKYTISRCIEDGELFDLSVSHLFLPWVCLKL